MKCIVFFLSSMLWAASLRSQSSTIENLRSELYSPQADKLATLFSLCNYGSSLQSDSFMHYAKWADDISNKNKDLPNHLLALFYIGKCLVYDGKADSALEISQTVLKQVNNIASEYKIYHQLLGLQITCLNKLRKYDETFSQCYKLLESGEKYNDLSAQIFASNSIGTAYFNFSSDFINTKKWWLQAYHLMNGSSEFNAFPQVLTNLSYLYCNVDSSSYGITHNHIDSAQFFLDLAFAVAKQTNSPKVFADCYTTQADIYSLEKKTAEAEKMLQKGLMLYKEIGNTASIIDGLGALADFNENQGKYLDAIVYQKEEEAYLNKSHSGQLTEFYRSFAANYEKTGNYMMADSMLRKFIHIQDSLYANKKVEDLSQLEAKYQLSNKEAAIAKQKFELLQKDIVIFSITTFIFLIAVGTYLIYRRNRRKQNIAQSIAEEKERKRIAADLHDNIGAYASAISAGIDEMESKKILTDQDAIQNLKSNATEIISSLRDTIWAFNKESISLTGISDRVKTYVQKMQPSYPLVSIKIIENMLQEIYLSPVNALHIFRIIQEAIHNALEHSDCGQIMITIESNAELVSVKIADNGIGFDWERSVNTGNGLQNMKRRADDAGMEIIFLQNIPNGTIVMLKKEDLKKK